MKRRKSYAEKFARIAPQSALERLPEVQQGFVRGLAFRHRFSQQVLRQVSEMALDFHMWREPPIQDQWEPMDGSGPEAGAEGLRRLRARWEGLRHAPKSYAAFGRMPPVRTEPIAFELQPKERLGLGWCPVASPRTRCCNLLTLDAVDNCGFDCSYCSIQSFYSGNRVRFDSGFADKLAALELEPDRVYHIGTGQSSDSLMWGNRAGVLDALIEFARRHPNVILELKTKSKNIAHLLRRDLPPNLLCTWSLNTPTLIRHEEHHTASLEQRLAAARRLAERGVLVGFHLHPMIHYDRWREDYGALCTRLCDEFSPAEVALVSLGTLTFTKAVMRRIRGRDFYSKILQMPLEEAAGKLSYPESVKVEMFRHAYQGLASWHGRVFFYLCMEHHRLWQPVFGFDYPSNRAFEAAMKASYLARIPAQGGG